MFDGYYRNRDKGELGEYFSIPCKVIGTTGTQEGIIVKFKTFYLKIYDAYSEDAYRVSGYRYNEQVPVFQEVIQSIRFREFANRFTQDNYLRDYQTKNNPGV